MIARALRRLGRDRRGVTVVEFAFVAPIMIMLIMGMGELMYQPYVQSVLTGAVQKAGRDSAIEDSVLSAEVTTKIDKLVEDAVRNVAVDARFDPKRESYSSFGMIKPEYFYDTDKDNVYDTGECFDDVNGNKKWDVKPGRTGQGGADDVTIYTMTVTYPRLFPIAAMFGVPTEQTISATTILKNQPFDAQKTQSVTKVCP